MAGTATAVTSGDVIPLLDDNGSGQYIKGRNSARDIRVGLLGSLFMAGADGFTPRAGVIPVANNVTDLAVNPQASPNQTVIVKKGYAVVPRSGQGAYLFYNEADQTLNMPAASAANFRTDLVCVFAADLGNFGADGAHGPQFWVEQGALGGGVPATPTGMLKLAEVFRAANDNTISTEIADKRVFTTLNGGVRILGAGDSLATPGQQYGELRNTTTSLQVWNGTAWVELADYAPARLVGKVRPTSNITCTNAGETVGGNITFTPRAGRSYRLKLSCGSYSCNVSASAIQGRFRSVAGAGPITSGSTQRGAFVMPVPNGLSQGGSWETTTDAGELGTSQITVGFTVQSAGVATASTLIGSAAGHETTFTVEDVT